MNYDTDMESKKKNNWEMSPSENSDNSPRKSRSRSLSVDKPTEGDVELSGDNQENNSPKPSFSRRNNDNQNTVEPSNCIGVFGLSKVTAESTLESIFEKFGAITSVKLIIDKFTKESLGFCFINYEDIEFANLAVQEANGMELDGKKIRVDYSRTKKAYTPTPGNYKGKQSMNRNRNFDNHRNEGFQRNFRGNDNRDRFRSRSPVMRSLNRRRSSTRRDSPPRNNNRYSPSRNDSKKYGQMRSDTRRYSPKRSDFRSDNARYSPKRDFQQRYAPVNRRDDHRKYSPARDEVGAYSPSRYSQMNESRGFPPKRIDGGRFSPMRNGHKSDDRRGYSPKRDDFRRFSPRRYSPKRDEPRRYSPKRDEPRRYSPKRDEPRRFSPRRYSPKRDEPRRYSPMRNDQQRGYSPKRDDRRRNSPMRTDMKRAPIAGSNVMRKYPETIQKRNDLVSASYPIRGSMIDSAPPFKDHREHRR